MIISSSNSSYKFPLLIKWRTVQCTQHKLDIVSTFLENLLTSCCIISTIVVVLPVPGGPWMMEIGEDDCNANKTPVRWESSRLSLKKRSILPITEVFKRFSSNTLQGNKNSTNDNERSDLEILFSISKALEVQTCY